MEVSLEKKKENNNCLNCSPDCCQFSKGCSFCKLFGIGLLAFLAVIGLYYLVNMSTGSKIIPPKPPAAIKEKLNGDYQWVWASEEDKGKYEKINEITWNRIVTSKYAGFEGKKAVEKMTKGCQLPPGKYLRVEGGLCGVGVWLEIGSKRIDSLEALKKILFPINSEVKAISLVAATTSGLESNQEDIPDGHFLITDGVFFIQLVKKNIFGCGCHQPTGVIYKVTEAGEIQEVASEKEGPCSGPVMCVD